MNEAVRRLSGPRMDSAYLDPRSRETGLRARIGAWLGLIRVQFALIVIVPTLAAGVYYGAIASKRYVSEAVYVVRGVTSNRASGLSALLTSFGISRTADDTSAIQAFMESRDAIAQLNHRVNLREVFGRSDADVLSRYPRFWERDNFETLYQTSQAYISVVQDPTKGITTLKVQSFRAGDSQTIARNMLEIAEDMVNKMNARAQADAVRNEADEVVSAEKDVTAAQRDLTAFRNQELLVDPNSFSTILLDAIGKLSIDLAQTSASIKETSRMSAASPVISSLQTRAETLGAGIQAQREKLAGSKSALADKMTSYDHLTLMRDLADKRYASALSTLDATRQDARRQQIYIEDIVQPNLADDWTEPQRWRSIMTVFVLCFAAFAMLWILTVGAKDHAQ